ncbi:TlpA family protein disulfide reductase [Chryseobacterium sp. SIMBA_029]|uniref:TlpA family protein disulfide reductase n=2 Tax=Pseudomonadati TaxID=3379134 RepID=UPI00397C0E99
MRKIFRTALFIVLVFSCALLRAQTIKPLKIGDKVPDVYFAKMLNYSKPDGQLSDFKGKAIIIDLWFKECVPCVSSMKHLDSLQNEFANDLQVLPVTWQPKTDIEKFWKTNFDVSGLQLSLAVEDTIVRKLFPASSFPHQIWIDRSGTVAAITDGKNASRENIKKLIGGKAIGLVEKKDEMDASVRYALNPDITIRYEQNKNKVLFYSYFSTFRDELTGMSSSQVDTINKKVRIIANNLTLVNLYDFAYTNNSGETHHYPTRIIRRDHNPVESGLGVKFDSTRLFCYDLIYKGTSTRGFCKYMIADLDRSFKVKSHEELRNIPCYVISANGKGVTFRKPIVEDGSKQVKNVSMKKDVVLIANKQWPWWLERNLNQYEKELILFEMGKEKQINFEVKWNLDNLKQMNKELGKYDLKIQKTKRKRKVIILEDA